MDQHAAGEPERVAEARAIGVVHRVEIARVVQRHRDCARADTRIAEKTGEGGPGDQTGLMLDHHDLRVVARDRPRERLDLEVSADLPRRHHDRRARRRRTVVGEHRDRGRLRRQTAEQQGRVLGDAAADAPTGDDCQPPDRLGCRPGQQAGKRGDETVRQVDRVQAPKHHFPRACGSRARFVGFIDHPAHRADKRVPVGFEPERAIARDVARRGGMTTGDQDRLVRSQEVAVAPDRRDDQRNAGRDRLGGRHVEAFAAAGQHHRVGVRVERADLCGGKVVVEMHDLAQVRMERAQVGEPACHVVVRVRKRLEHQTHVIAGAEGTRPGRQQHVHPFAGKSGRDVQEGERLARMPDRALGQLGQAVERHQSADNPDRLSHTGVDQGAGDETGRGEHCVEGVVEQRHGFLRDEALLPEDHGGAKIGRHVWHPDRVMLTDHHSQPP